jgi:putative ABC transport system substrate-binding protein
LRRRDFIKAIAGSAAASRAQQPALPVVGYLSPGAPESGRQFLAAALNGLEETGFVEGRNVAIEYRWARDQYDRLSSPAEELVRREVAVIVTGCPVWQDNENETHAPRRML